MPRSLSLSSLLAAVVAAILGNRYNGALPPSKYDDAPQLGCHPFLPPLFVETPPAASHPTAVLAASRTLEDLFATRFAKGDIDSLSVAVITSEGALYERNFGLLRGNESKTSPSTTSDASYRIASISKMFMTYEGFILQQKSRLSWHDKVDKYFPQFKYRLDGFNPSEEAPTQNESPVTLFQLATHMSGLGRDWPPGVASDWPHAATGGGPPPINGLPFPSHDSVFKAIEQYHMVSPPFYYPSYSNTGTGLLGLILVAANGATGSTEEPETYAELMKRDVFEPLGLSGSHFLTTEENRHSVVVPSSDSEIVDQDFLDAMNSAGGQFASLSDFIKLTQVILNPRRSESLLTPYSVNNWMQPVHTFEEDNWTEMGFMWEIVKIPDSNGRPRKIYWKLGEVGDYHSTLAIHPGTGYGISILMASRHPDASSLVYEAFKTFQPAIDSALAEMSRALYAGKWMSEDGQSLARIVVEKGTLWLEQLQPQGVDALKLFGSSGRLALRYSGRRDEFRIDTGMADFNGAKHIGCYSYWVGQDLWGVRDGAAINVLYFTGDEAMRQLHVPSLSMTMSRA
ncbi:hypothetical protein EIP91_008782 [Steccherinum ochraceum]|uniref:Beta-lactamase-related domain-containing protein n=1 Tax=Steccherinum ochraceum TaxID=92696 RepID=A0A4R0R532_9APHY|nr:hypothetical protein EIP91_008782 [Steccherinum ochraceum]